MIPQLSTALTGRYRIERELGSGGIATVYLAEDLKHHRKVAIKVLKPELAASLGAERFLREIETTANLRHGTRTSCRCTTPVLRGAQQCSHDPPVPHGDAAPGSQPMSLAR